MKIKKVFYDKIPNSIENIGNGTHLYRWDIEEVDSDNMHCYSCYEVVIYGAMSSNSIIEQVLSAVYGTDVEAKLINDYNAVNEGILDISYKDRYIQYLSDRKCLKEQIEKDYGNFKE